MHIMSCRPSLLNSVHSCRNILRYYVGDDEKVRQLMFDIEATKCRVTSRYVGTFCLRICEMKVLTVFTLFDTDTVS